MSNGHRKLDMKQISLFEMIQKQKESKKPIEGSLNFTIEFKKVLSACVSRSKYSVYEIASRMTEYLDNGTENSPVITHHMIYAWTSLSKLDYEPRPSFLPAFCYGVGGMFDPIEFLAGKTNMYLLPGKEALRSEIQKIEEDIEHLKQEKEKRLFFLSACEEKDKP